MQRLNFCNNSSIFIRKAISRFLLIFVVVLTTACQSIYPEPSSVSILTPSPEPVYSFEAFLTDTNALHTQQSTAMLMQGDIRQYMRDLPPGEMGFTEEELQSLTKNISTYGSMTNRLNQEGAVKDIDLMFRMFYYCYGCYEYFGGTSAFDTAKKGVLTDIATFGDSLTVGDLYDSILSRLSFIKDAHVWIESVPLFPLNSYYYNEDIAFQKDSQGYFTLTEGEKQYVTAVNGADNLEDCMKLTIGDDGALEYQLGVLDEAGKEHIDIQLSLNNGTETITLNETVPGATYNRYQHYAEDLDGDVPVITCRSFIDQKLANQLIAAAPVFQENPITILDLRGNGGGSQGYVEEWLEAVNPGGLGKFKESYSDFDLDSKAHNYIMAQYAKMPSPPEIIASMIMIEQGGYYGYLAIAERSTNQCNIISKGVPFNKIPHEELLIVLVDQNTGSAGERMLEALRNIDNVVFVGTNSLGSLIGGTCTFFCSAEFETAC